MTLNFGQRSSLLASVLPALTIACAVAASPAGTRAPEDTAPGDAAGGANATTGELDVVETTALHGFELAPTNDPEVRRMSDGSLFVVFNCMPPCFTADDADGPPALGKYSQFDQEMREAVGVDVNWEDREFFRIRNPKPDTMSRLQDFVAGYHHREPQL
jgi:hypothetical protein